MRYNVPVEINYNPEKQTRGMFKSVLFLAVVFGFMAFAVYSYLNYVDLTNACVIRLKRNVSRGNTEVIKEALKEMKSLENGHYYEMCEYVDRIQEDDCNVTYRAYPYQKRIDTDVCYFEGTKTVMISPNLYLDKDNVGAVVTAVKEGTKMSKAFWVAHENIE